MRYGKIKNDDLGDMSFDYLFEYNNYNIDDYLNTYIEYINNFDGSFMQDIESDKDKFSDLMVAFYEVDYMKKMFVWQNCNTILKEEILGGFLEFLSFKNPFENALALIMLNDTNKDCDIKEDLIENISELPQELKYIISKNMLVVSDQLALLSYVSYFDCRDTSTYSEDFEKIFQIEWGDFMRKVSADFSKETGEKVDLYRCLSPIGELFL